jgi:hypothetical protein
MILAPPELEAGGLSSPKASLISQPYFSTLFLNLISQPYFSTLISQH